ncbi:polyamine aminopropyltransferase [Flavobacterium psychrophilum]|uniref:polyamine aminopropyltransferase n=1 Tax=Flavobacterium psychrophilum TaxID=96345 RepID=UPI000B7C0CB0|nr:polyamine aminopropyltransferase [Flavobacterium psychrophilum]EKT4508657.1 polyamine aminopropyltransferase [Flavobacterium psychrophilum]ELY1978956.1 polyamine aminopropyltransferase [Flavobacterium psychrophilum]MEB3378647.1 polyamine aminopropyltransferase [Flavobacterium psychrophilum]SNA87747.1 putative spermidine synthase 1 [Flavobacterium psychrophilum]
MGKKFFKFEYLLLFAVFTIATCGLVYELVAGTLASYLLGDSVKQFSFIIGVYLFSMGIGSYFSKFFSKNLLDTFVEIEILVGLIGGLSSVVLFLMFESVYSFQLLLYFLVFVTGCLVGLEIPLLMNILKDKVEFKDLVSNVFTFDYIGALLASILFPLFLVPKLGIMGTSLFFGMINISIAIALCFLLKKELKKIRILRFKAIFSFLILLSVFLFSDVILSFSEGKLYGENIIYTHSTQYQRIVLTHNKNDYRLYLNNNLQFSSADEYRYHEALVHPAMAMAKKVDHVLVLGGGDGLAVRELLKYPEVKDITLVDLDQGMTKLFKTNKILTGFNHNSLNNPKVKVYNQDAYIWAKSQTKHYDIVIIDFPDPSNYSLGKLYSLNFYWTVKNILAPDAVLVIQTTSPYFAPKSFWCINKTAQQVFPQIDAYHAYVPSFGEWGYTIAINSFATNFNTVNRTVKSLQFYDYQFRKLNYFSQDMRNNDVEINRLDNQILVRYFDEEWGKIQ